MDSIEIARVVDRGIRESGFIDWKKLCIKEGERVWSVSIDIYCINDDGNVLEVADVRDFDFYEAHGRLYRGRVRLLGIDAVLLDRHGNGRLRNDLFIGQRLQRRHRDVVAVDFEKAAQLLARVGAAEAVGPQREQAARDPGIELLGNGPHVGNRVGHVQGGVTMGLGIATAEAALPPTWMLSAVTAWYISPGEGRTLKARSKVVHRGRLTAVVRTEIFGKNNRRVMEMTTAHASKSSS